MCNLKEDASYEKIPFPEERKAIDVGDFICDYQAFQSTFDWDPKVKFQEGISKSIDYFRKNFNYYI
jgi:nucleoside-diphosphate-sugar epimerase